VATAQKTVHIFVEVRKGDQRKLEFEQDQVTGREIKEKAGVSLESDLGRREQGGVVLVTNDQTITIENGQHFVVLPSGTIS
jgi:hypothetical protein